MYNIPWLGLSFIFKLAVEASFSNRTALCDRIVADTDYCSITSCSR